MLSQIKDIDKGKWLIHVNEIIQQTKNQSRMLNFDQILTEKSAQRLQNLEQANRFQLEFYQQLKSELFTSIEDKQLLTSVKKDDTLFPFPLKYLIKDWGQEHQKYNEEIASLLQQSLKDHLRPDQSALFLGCGCARLVVELAKSYKEVVALDKSLPMIWSIHELKKRGQWKVAIKNPTNSKTVADCITKATLEMTQQQQDQLEKNIRFVVGDLIDLKEYGKGFDHIYSVYFTDVLPLKILWKKVNDSLSSGGLFIHFGPLEYFFTNENEMLTTEEIADYFGEQGYTIIHNDFYERDYLYVNNSMRRRIYSNWFFIAQKPVKTVQKNLWKTPVKRHQSAMLKEEKIIDATGNSITNLEVCLNDRVYKLPQVIFDMIQRLDGQTTLNEILESFGIDQVDDQQKEKLQEIFQQLAEEDIIKY